MKKNTAAKAYLHPTCRQHPSGCCHFCQEQLDADNVPHYGATDAMEYVLNFHLNEEHSKNETSVCSSLPQ